MIFLKKRVQKILFKITPREEFKNGYQRKRYRKIKTVKCRKESKKGCNGKSIKCITHNLWDELEIHINKFFENNTLNDILFKEVGNNSKEMQQ